jgi:hypothetical protein
MAKIDQRESKSKMAKGSPVKAVTSIPPADLADEELLECVQRQTFRYFWEAAHPVSGLAPDRLSTREEAVDDRIAIGGSGFGIIATTAESSDNR